MSASVKRSDKIIYYKPAREEEDAGGDTQQLLAFLLVFGGMMFKVDACEIFNHMDEKN